MSTRVSQIKRALAQVLVSECRVMLTALGHKLYQDGQSRRANAEAPK